MKTEKLPNVPAQEPGDFYYTHLRLPHAADVPAEELPHEPDPAIADLMDIFTKDGNQLGFVILRNDNSVEIVDTVTGEHVRIRLGDEGGENPTEQILDALIKVALMESRALTTGLAEIVGYLEERQRLAALGALRGLDEKFKFLGLVLDAAARLP